MSEILEMFTPYMVFISFLLTVLVNWWLISKNIHWVVIIIGNLLLILVMEFLNLAEYNFLNVILDWFFGLIGGIFSRILDFIAEIADEVWDSTIGALIERIKDFFGI